MQKIDSRILGISIAALLISGFGFLQVIAQEEEGSTDKVVVAPGEPEVPEQDEVPHKTVKGAQDRNGAIKYDTFTLIDDDQQSGSIDYDTKIRHYAQALYDKGKLPKKYQSDAVAEDITMVVDEMRNGMKNLKADVQADLKKYGISGVPAQPPRSPTANAPAENAAVDGLFDHSGTEAGCAVFSPDGPALPDVLSSSHFRLHYTTTGTHAVPTADTSPANGIPDYVETIKSNLETGWNVNNAKGWLAPLSDGSLGGGTDKIDVYFYDLVGGFGFFGVAIAAGEDLGTSNPNDAFGYMCVDNDLGPTAFFGFVADLRQATSVHELHHLVEYAYNYDGSGEERSWMFESTASWFEDEVFDSNNRCPSGRSAEFMADPDVKLVNTAGSREYASCIWHIFYTDMYGDQVMRRTWENAADNADTVGIAFTDNTAALSEATSLGYTETLYNFGVNNMFTGPGRNFDRGQAFTATEAATWKPLTDFQTAAYTGIALLRSNTDGELAGGGMDYVKATSTVSDMKVTFDGEDAGSFLVTLALYNAGTNGDDVQVLDFVLNVSDVGSITIVGANTYEEIDVIIRNSATGTTATNRGWSVTFGPP
jgi:hypothetical protein